ncbi:histone H1-delta-like [Ornithodoros turicata]|uniref:histone H1-delta-like n=1 Tax=Ornithodoros turicata TaxID=34597 RepID=UPI003139830F
MSETEVAKAPATPKAKGRKPAGVKKDKKPANHPKYTDMVKKAVAALKERGGSSRQAIHKYIMANFDVGKDSKVVNTHLKLALKRAVESGLLKHAKGTGASGSFRLADKTSGSAEKKTKAAPAAKKAAKPKKAASPKKKAAPKKEKKAASPKKASKPKVAKAAKPKTPKKAKSPKKPKAKKAPTKKTGAKK